MEPVQIKLSRAELDRIYKDFDDEQSERIELALKDGESILAYASGLVEGRLFYLSDMWVDKSLRRQHHGSHLLAETEQLALSHGCDEVYLWTAGEENKSFYLSNGYTQFVCFENSSHGKDRYGMRKSLS